MYINLLKSYFFHPLWILTFIVLSVPSITSIAHAAPDGQSNSEGHYYYVRKGDTLSQIAKSYNVSVEDLVYFNSLKNPDLIHVGDPLYIPASSDMPTCNQHTVTVGQTLSDIAAHYNVNLHELAEINHIYNIDHIKIGMKICIPQSDEIPTEGIDEVSDSFGTLFLRRGQLTERVHKITHFRPQVLLDFSDTRIKIDDTVHFVLLEDILLVRYSSWYGYSDGENDAIGLANIGECRDTNRIWEIIGEPVMTRIDGGSGTLLNQYRPINHFCLFRSDIDWLTLETSILHEFGYNLFDIENYIITEDTNGAVSLLTFSRFTDEDEFDQSEPCPPEQEGGPRGCAPSANQGKVAECRAIGCNPNTCSSFRCWVWRCCYVR